MLVLPVIDLSGGTCVRRSGDRVEPETQFFTDPVRMAKLWRVMNARVLHLADVDAAAGTAPPGASAEVVAAVTAVLDIPVQVGGGLRSAADAETMLAAGAARVVLDHETPPADAAEAVAKLGASRVVPSVAFGLERDDEAMAAAAVDLAARGARRLLCRSLAPDPAARPTLGAYRAVADALREAGHRVRLTAADGVGGYRDLLALSALEPHGLDSVVIGRALYEGRFPCQQFWSWHRKDTLDLDRFSTAPLVAR